jgi:hypothetical protein
VGNGKRSRNRAIGIIDTTQPHTLRRTRLLLTIFDTYIADCSMNSFFDAGVGFNIRRARLIQHSTRASGGTWGGTEM